MKRRWKDEQRKQRVQRREYLKKHTDEELAKMLPEDRKKKLEKE